MGKTEESNQSLLENLPKEAQARFVRVMSDLVVADVCREYGVDPAELMKELPDPISRELGPDEYRRLAEIAVIEQSNPIADVTDPGELLKIWHETKKRKGGENGQEQE